MSSNNGPYFIEGAELRSGTESSMYPDLGQSAVPDAQMYALAGGAMQAHQEHSLIGGLLQAANEAADHEVHHQSALPRQGKEDSQEQDGEQEQHSFNVSLSLPPPDGNDDPRRTTRKRKRGKENGAVNIMPETQEPVSPSRTQRSQFSTSTASALFRRPLETSKKYTRPPMSKMFVSLELSAEDFLQLQSAAKGYMLNAAFPDRQDTVGQRGKGDSELVKLRLWNCVKGFLEEEGNGERFFGPEVLGDEGAQRTMIWPRDKNAIIGAITPLLRRMVTNERQRVYAIETRKGGEDGESAVKRRRLDEGESGGLMGNGDFQHGGLFSKFTGSNLESYDTRELYIDSMLTPLLEAIAAQMELPEEDVKATLAALSYHIHTCHEDASLRREGCPNACEENFIERMIDTGMLEHGNWGCPATGDPEVKRESMRRVLSEAARVVKSIIDRRSPFNLAADSFNAISDAVTSISPNPRSNQSVMLQLSLLQSGKRLGSRRDVLADTCPYLHTVIHEATTFMGPSSIPTVKVRALCPEGLITVEDDKSWERILGLAKEAEWMDGEMKVLVELA